MRKRRSVSQDTAAATSTSTAAVRVTVTFVAVTRTTMDTPITIHPCEYLAVVFASECIYIPETMEKMDQLFLAPHLLQDLLKEYL